ncbi:MAG: CDP-alcohol phosphatidyltransferase family protein [Actinomycetes bacterium]
MNRYKELTKTIGWAGLVSLASLLCSWAAIGFLLGHEAKLAIVFASIAFQLDALDGFIARKLGTTSDFGRQLDSMADLINYSLLAALVTSQLLLPNTLGFIAGFFILAFGILRLVSFNIAGHLAEGDRLYYQGIVTCHLSLAALLIFVAEKLFPITSWPYSDWVVAAILIGLSVGQLSQIKTRKTGVLIFWIPVSIVICIGALIWL